MSFSPSSLLSVFVSNSFGTKSLHPLSQQDGDDDEDDDDGDGNDDYDDDNDDLDNDDSNNDSSGYVGDMVTWPGQ